MSAWAGVYTTVALVCVAFTSVLWAAFSKVGDVLSFVGFTDDIANWAAADVTCANFFVDTWTTFW